MLNHQELQTSVVCTEQSPSATP